MGARASVAIAQRIRLFILSLCSFGKSIVNRNDAAARSTRRLPKARANTARLRNSQLRGGVHPGDGDGIGAGTRRAQSSGEVAETAAGPCLHASQVWVAVFHKPIGYGSVRWSVIVCGQCQGVRARLQCILEIDDVAVSSRRVPPHLCTVEEKGGRGESARWNWGSVDSSAGVAIGLNGDGFGRIRSNIEQCHLIIGGETSLEESGSKARRNRQAQ